MPDYKKGKIYELVCRITGEKYVGSTVDSLSRRLVKHRLKQNNCSSRQIIERGDYYINLLEDCPCENKEQLRKKEREWYDTIEGGCINKYRPCVSIEEKKQTLLDYIDNNKDKKKKRESEKITCECGVIIRKGDISRHKGTDKHKLLLEKNIQLL